MKTMLIQPFIEATTRIFEQFGLTCRMGAPVTSDTPFFSKDILSLIGVTGDIRGKIYLGIPMTSALMIVSKMMGGFDVSELDSMAQSALSELSNMICGNAITLFSQEDFSLDITPPTLILGDKVMVSVGKMIVQSIPIFIDGMESLEMNIVLEEK